MTKAFTLPAPQLDAKAAVLAKYRAIASLLEHVQAEGWRLRQTDSESASGRRRQQQSLGSIPERQVGRESNGAGRGGQASLPWMQVWP